MKYEFYVYTQEGDDVWHWDLKQTDKVIQDINNNKHDYSFSVEVLHWLSENDCDYIQIYPIDNSKDLPKYVQKQVKIIYESIKEKDRFYNIFRYYIDYYSQNKFDENYEIARARELEKFGVVLSKKDYESHDGYANAFVITDYIDDIHVARKKALELSIKTNNDAYIRREYAYLDEKNNINWEYDEDYIEHISEELTKEYL